MTFFLGTPGRAWGGATCACGEVFQKTSPSHRFCPGCAAERGETGALEAERGRADQARARLGRPAPDLTAAAYLRELAALERRLEIGRAHV